MEISMDDMLITIGKQTMTIAVLEAKVTRIEKLLNDQAEKSLNDQINPKKKK